MHWGVGRPSQVVLLVEEVGESYRRESQGEGESPSCILPAFFEHLLCASPQSLSWALPHAAWEGFWVCFYKMCSPVHRRAGPGHLRGLMGGSASSATAGGCSQLASGQGGLGVSVTCHLVLGLQAPLLGLSESLLHWPLGFALLSLGTIRIRFNVFNPLHSPVRSGY